ncbi:MAG: hypothetical protein AB1585_16435 [Thermodesulfobacteriota bacterium]
MITLDAFLQWMAPVTLSSPDEDGLAGIYAEAIRYQLLPRETFFQLRDFQVFADMGIETKQLPSEDVEACLREIKLAGPQHDPSKAEDREKIGQIIQRYFADPGTKYRRILEELQSKSENLSKELSEEKQIRLDAEKGIAELETQRKEMTKQIENGKKDLTDANVRIEKLEKVVQDRKNADMHKRLVASVVRRTILTAAIFLIIEFLIGYLISLYGEGSNYFRKLTGNWVWLGLGFAFVALIYPFIMGRERMSLLKWWKGEIS